MLVSLENMSNSEMRTAGVEATLVVRVYTTGTYTQVAPKFCYGSKKGLVEAPKLLLE
jgi:hypothetical protein